jgi:hypothetical protein
MDDTVLFTNETALQYCTVSGAEIQSAKGAFVGRKSGLLGRFLCHHLELVSGLIRNVFDILAREWVHTHVTRYGTVVRYSVIIAW